MKFLSVLFAVLLSTTMLSVVTPAQGQESPVDSVCEGADPERCADGFFVEFFANAAGTSPLPPALSFVQPAGLTIYARPQINETGVFAPTAMQLTVVLEVDCGGVAADGPILDCNQGEFPAGDAVVRKTLNYAGTTPLAFTFSAEELQNLFAPGVSVTAIHLLGVFSGEPAFRTSSYHPLTQAMFANNQDATADSLDRSGLWQPVLLESVQPTYNALRNGGFEGEVIGFDLNDPLGFGAFRGFQGNDFTLFTTASDGGKFNKLDTASGGEVVAAPGLGQDGSQAAKGGNEGHYAGGSGRTTKVALESDGSPFRNLLGFTVFVKTGPTSPMTTIMPFFRIDTNRDGISDNCLVGESRTLVASPEFTPIEFNQDHPYFLGGAGCSDGSPRTPLSQHQSNPSYATAALRDVYFQTKAPTANVCGSDNQGGCPSKTTFGATDFVLYDNAAATVQGAPPLPGPLCLAIDDDLKELLEAQLGPGYDCAHANNAVKHIAAADWYIEAIHAGVHYYIGPGAGGFSTFAPASTENRIFLGNSNDAGAPQAGPGALLDLCPKPGAGSGTPIGNPALTPLCGLGTIADDGGSGTMLRLTVDSGSGVCTVDLKRAGPSGTAFAQYAQYSDLDNDGFLDQAELTGAGDGNPLSSCAIGVPNPISDSDGDGLDDSDEDADGDGQLDAGETDPANADTDGDGLNDCQETGYVANSPALGESEGRSCGINQAYATNPRNPDSDGDGLSDGDEVDHAQPSNPTKADTDGDLVHDANERSYTSNPSDKDSDDDGLEDGFENANKDGVRDAGETNALAADSDSDGLTDCRETGYVANSPDNGRDPSLTPDCGAQKYRTDPLVADSDGDTFSDGAEAGNVPPTNPTDATSKPDPDTDGDGISDVNEAAYGSMPDNVDTDGDGLKDGEENTDKDGVRDAGETNALAADSDSDGLTDCQETGFVANTGTTGEDSASTRDCGAGVKKYKTNPLAADSDGDSISDRDEVQGNYAKRAVAMPCNANAQAAYVALRGLFGTAITNGVDLTPADNQVKVCDNRVPTNPTKADSDDDLLSDDKELGNGGTAAAGKYLTDPNDADSDNDTLVDGAEAADGTSPTNINSDADTLTDCQETGFVANTGTTGEDTTSTRNCGTGVKKYKTNPIVADSDGDTLTDSAEVTAGTNPTTADSDLDGLSDCQETGFSGLKPNNGEDTSNTRDCKAGATALKEYFTNPLVADSDGDTFSDGAEVNNVPPANPTSSDSKPTDTDGDGISNADEVAYGSNPANADSDGDKLDDGVENANKDGVRDAGETNAIAADSDSDGLTDCQEVGFVATIGATGENTASTRNCGTGVKKYNTNPLAADSDNDTILDGVEVAATGAAGVATNPTTRDTDGDLLNDCQEVVAVNALTGTVAVASDPVFEASGCPTTIVGYPTLYDGKKYRTDPTVNDSDGDSSLLTVPTDGLDGHEVDLGTNPTDPTDPLASVVGDESDQVCAMAMLADSCTGTALAAASVAAAGPLAILNTLRLPDPVVAATDANCNFLDPAAWGFPMLGYDGDVVRMQGPTESEEEYAARLASNGLIDWKDGGYLLWNGDACNDLGDPADDDEVAGAPDDADTADGFYSQHLGNYLLNTATGAGVPNEPPTQEEIEAMVADLSAMLGEQIGDAYAFNLADRLDVADVDEDGVTEEPNGQVDLVEQRLLIVDPHGTAFPASPLGEAGSGSQASPLTGDLPDDRDGVSLLLRNPVGGALVATVSAYVPAANEPVLIIEAFQSTTIVHLCVILQPTPSLVGPFTGRYDGDCAGEGPTVACPPGTSGSGVPNCAPAPVGCGPLGGTAPQCLLDQVPEQLPQPCDPVEEGIGVDGDCEPLPTGLPAMVVGMLTEALCGQAPTAPICEEDFLENLPEDVEDAVADATEDLPGSAEDALPSCGGAQVTPTVYVCYAGGGLAGLGVRVKAGPLTLTL